MEQPLQCAYDFGFNESAGCLEGVWLLLWTWDVPQRPAVAGTQQLRYRLQHYTSYEIAISYTSNKHNSEHNPMDTERRLDRVSDTEDNDSTR